jgi:hypothetical protein
LLSLLFDPEDGRSSFFRNVATRLHGIIAMRKSNLTIYVGFVVVSAVIIEVLFFILPQNFTDVSK